MQAAPIDPRDGRWRQRPSGYRVDFWRQLSPTPVNPAHAAMFEADEWWLEDVSDVREVLAWADAKADGRTYTVYAVVDRGDDRGAVHIVGVNPTEHD